MKVNKKRITLDLLDTKKTAVVGKALSSEMRLEILKYLIVQSANISEIAAKFGIPQSSAALHVKVLEEAGMISVNEKPGLRGSQKICGISFEDIYLNAFPPADYGKSRTLSFSMPIGNYFDCKISGNCGIISEKGYLGIEDFPSGFYCANRHEAQLLWFESGFLEYRFPAGMSKNVTVRELSFSFEICSEAPGYQNDWPSDITVWVNGAEVDTILSRGDYGGRRGRLNPEWWGNGMTQYGEFKVIRINSFGCFENDFKCSDHTIEAVSALNTDYISFRLGVKEDAVHRGGMNLFGEKFGDYPQNLVMTLTVDHDVPDEDGPWDI
ncbi:MAG: helix-turn-helix domain-containing protein [Parasporobacterium sp.]|nr:helix-turn-helix domain-containing protein [Parasporobacterium sp.]